MLIPFQVIAAITILSTAIAFLWKKAWWIRLFDFPRLQIIFLQIIALAGMLFFMEDFDWLNLSLTGLTLFTMVFQIVYIFPYLPFRKKDVLAYRGNSGRIFSAMVANVLMKNRKCHKLIDLVKRYQPDILLAVETDLYWDKHLQKLDQYYNYRVKIPLDNTYGMLLFSKLELKSKKIEFIYKDDVPSIHAEVVLDGSVFRLICLHPEPPVPDESATSLPRDLELILVGRMIKKDPAPYLVIGDLNDVAWSDTSYKFRRISELKDPRVGRGFYNTYHAKLFFMRWALDHVFVTDHFKLHSIKRMPRIGSDHFPIFIQLGLEEES